MAEDTGRHAAFTTEGVYFSPKTAAGLAQRDRRLWLRLESIRVGGASGVGGASSPDSQPLYSVPKAPDGGWLPTPPPANADGEAVYTHAPGVTEKYTLNGWGLEQTFVLERPAVGQHKGHVLLILSIDTAKPGR